MHRIINWICGRNASDSEATQNWLDQEERRQMQEVRERLERVREEIGDMERFKRAHPS